MVDILKKELNMDFDDAVERVRTIVAEQGFSVMLVKNIDDIFKKKLSIDNYPRYTIILACAPQFAKGALDVSKNVGLLFPCSFAVFEDEGKVFVGHVSIMKIAPEVGLAPHDKMKPVIEDTGKAVHAAWDKF
ncbi:MAG: DUF302 domain-containing protein [Candidatus Lokiarchaeota archaeon]|nr:DUF302 domain-containing protein [Candidatus Lokiarchaeota archaeon]MBD3342231.1 DUF302 domain-containing protein [Candidatus Lokiarchaeota archaeon]